MTFDSHEETFSKDSKEVVDQEYKKFKGRPFWVSLCIAFIIIFVTRWSVISPYYVPTGSMMPSVVAGDRLLGHKLSYGLILPLTQSPIVSWRTPSVGDILIFRNPNISSINYVKRVVGTPGDVLQIQDGVLFRNDLPITGDDYIEKSGQREYKISFDKNSESWLNWGPTTVPADSVFVMSDHRSDQNDSRSFGAVHQSDFIAQAVLILWSQDPEQGKSRHPLRKDRIFKWL